MLIKSIVEKRLERLIFIRAELLKPQPSIRGEREQASKPQSTIRGEREQESLNQLLGEREQASLQYYSTSVSEQGGIFEPSATSPNIEGIIILRKR